MGFLPNVYFSKKVRNYDVRKALNVRSLQRTERSQLL